MQVIELELPGVRLLQPTLARDERGGFVEAWNLRTLAAAGISANFVQENVSASGQYVLRGLHYQLRPAQGKLIRVLQGRIFDVVVDLRRSSATYGRATCMEMYPGEYRSLWVPPGFAHGFLSLSASTLVQYAVTEHWSAESERVIAWNDASLDIAWPLPRGVEPTLSDKDRAGVLLRSAETYP